MSKLYYPSVFHETEANEKGFWVEFPDLPGCITEGNTLEEIVEMAKKVLGTWFMPKHKHDSQQYPTPTKPNNITLEKHTDFIILIEFDSIEWAKKYNNKAVKKTLTIPA